MSRAICVLILGAGLSANALPGQAPTQRLLVEEVSRLAAETKPTAESVEDVRARIGRGDYAQARRLADEARGFRIVISLEDRALWVLRDDDTLRTASVGVASGETLEYGGRSWRFRTPRGKRTVIDARVAPYWTPPDWAYVETATRYNLKLAWLSPTNPVTLRDGRRLTVENGAVGLRDGAGVFRALPRDEHIVFESTLYVPPFGTVNRRLKGLLGPYALYLGDSYLLHGGPSGEGLAPTRGCIRLSDDDLEWLYRNVDIGTAVYIY